MDVFVLLVFALFFTGLVISATTSQGLLRVSVRRPRLFQLAAVAAAAITVPVDLYAVIYGTVGPSGVEVEEVAGRLLLLNVAASCGAAAVHESLRGSSLAWAVLPEIPVAAGGATAPAEQPTATVAAEAGAAQAAAAPEADQTMVTTQHEPAEQDVPLRMGVLGWIGPLVALIAVTAMVALGSRGSGPEVSNLGSVWACYSLLICLISAYALLRGQARGAIDPREG